MADAEAVLRELERTRCEAIANGDHAALGEMLSDDYVHVHMTGAVDDKAGHIRAVAARPRRPVRGPLHVRIYADLAVLTGDLTNRIAGAEGGAIRETHAYCQQVAVRTGGRWRFVSCQLTPKAAPQA